MVSSEAPPLQSPNPTLPPTHPASPPLPPLGCGCSSTELPRWAGVSAPCRPSPREPSSASELGQVKGTDPWPPLPLLPSLPSSLMGPTLPTAPASSGPPSHSQAPFLPPQPRPQSCPSPLPTSPRGPHSQPHIASPCPSELGKAPVWERDRGLSSTLLLVSLAFLSLIFRPLSGPSFLPISSFLCPTSVTTLSPGS